MCTALLLIDIYPHVKFQNHIFFGNGVMLRTKFKYENEQRGITKKLSKAELLFVCTALFLIIIDIYTHVKFQSHSLLSFEVMLRTKKCDGLIDWLTERKP